MDTKLNVERMGDMYLMYENGMAILVLKEKKGVILYDKSVWQGGKFIEVKSSGREQRKEV